MKKTMIKVAGIMAISMLVLAGCGNKGKESTDKKSTDSSSKVEEKMIEVTDSKGKVEVPLKPKKVVVFDMGSLDTIQALGCGDTIVGTPVENLPAYLNEFAKGDSVGGIKEPDFEKINQLAPDLIVISGRQEDSMEQLKAIAPTIYLEVDTKDTWNSTKNNIELLAKIFDKEDVAKEKIATIEKDIKEIKEKADASSDKALVTLVSEGELSGYGNGSRYGIIYDTFGFKEADDQIKESTHGQTIAYEYVLEKNPDIIFVIDRTKAIGGDDSKNNVAGNELVKQTNAGKNNKVISLTADVWYLSGGGIDCTELMIADVSKALE